MGKLIFYYGVMGCSKSANALMTKFQYEERGQNIWLIKPSLDTRADDKYQAANNAFLTKRTSIVESRVGIKAIATNIYPEDNLRDMIKDYLVDYKRNTIICDEVQFMTPQQIEQLRDIVEIFNIDVLCYGLRTDFTSILFPGSKRLFELADEVHELESICECGRHAIINARVSSDGLIITNGDQIAIGGDELYKPLCWTCFKKLIFKGK